MNFAIDGTIWEDFPPNPFQFSLIALLEGLCARGHKVTILAKSMEAPPDQGLFASFPQGSFQWLKAESSLPERLSRNGWIQKTIPRQMKSRGLAQWVGIEGEAYPSGVAQAIFLTKSQEPDKDALTSRQAQASRQVWGGRLADPERIWLTFTLKTARILEEDIPEAKGRIFYVPALYRKMASVSNAEQFKAVYADSREYFLWWGPMKTGGPWVEALKAFSLFKARQRSHMPLLLAPWNKPNEEVMRNLGAYKYKNDVHLLAEDPQIRTEAVRFAYALLNNIPQDEIGWAAALAIGEGVPLISIPNKGADWAGSTVEWVHHGDPQSLAAAMMHLYTDERFRSQLLSRIADLKEKRDPDLLISVYEEVLLKRTGQ
jgi:hypothetical protein